MNENDNLILQIDKDNKKNLSSHRYAHTWAVAYTAAALSMRYGYNIEDARLAGVLHDCAKYMSDNDLINICIQNKETISEVEYDNPQLIHAKAGSIIAKTIYNITDPYILNAVRYHTTGRPNMTDIEKTIFVADYIEPLRRPLPNLDIIRKTAFIDINKSIEMILKSTLDYLAENGAIIDDTTRATYNYYVSLNNSSNN